MLDLIDSVRKLLVFDLPALPFAVKIVSSVIVVSFMALLLVAMWRDPSSLASLDPVTYNRLQQGVVSFFRNRGQFPSPAATVFGEAKDIVRRMKSEPDVFTRVQMEIESRKKNDNNWTFANILTEAKALVNALGLTPETKRENELFLQMPLPDLDRAGAPKAGDPATHGA
jgi:hypothetical protein